MKTAIIHLHLIFVLFGSSLVAQTTIRGTVVGEREEPIIGANISVAGTYDGASSDLEGQFEFVTPAKDSQIIRITYLGYEDWTAPMVLNGTTVNLRVALRETANELNTVTISAGAFEAGDEKKAAVLSSLDIVLTAGSLADISAAMNTLPGTATVGEDGRLFVRGGAAYETRTFFDGMAVDRPYTSNVPNVPARGRFSPFLFKGTTFSTGGYSAEFGQAMSSALLLNTADLPNETVTSVGLMTLGGNAAHTQLWERSSLAVSGGFIDLGPTTQLAKQNVDWQTPYRGQNGSITFRQKTSELGIFKAHVEGNQGKMALTWPSDEQSNGVNLNNKNVFAQTTWRESLGDKWMLFAGSAYSYFADDIYAGFRLKTRDQNWQAKLSLTNYISENITLRFGGEHWRDELDETYQDIDSTSFRTQLNERYTSAFVETDWYLSRKLVLRAGTRIEYSELLDNWNVAPRLSLAYKTGTHDQFSFAYGKYYQNPEDEVLRYNTDLNFEHANHYILSYQLVKRSRIFRVEAYHKSYENLVTFDATTPWQSTNNGDGYARGIDFFLRERSGFIPNGDLWVSYSFLDTKRLWRDFPVESTPSFASAHNLSLVYKHFFSKWSTTAGLTYTYGSPRPFNNPNESIFNNQRTKAFQDLSINASHLTNLFGQFTVLFLSVNNLPGFKNSFGNRYTSTPDANGNFAATPILPTANRFFMVGCFVSIGESWTKNKGVVGKDGKAKRAIEDDVFN